MSVPNNDKNRAKNSVFFDCIFYLILEGFWGGFGRALGGVLELFFATWGYFFEFARTFLDFLPFWQDKLPKFTRCGGQEALEGYFGIHFGEHLA